MAAKEDQMPASHIRMPLEGIKVLDLTIVQLGPIATCLLGSLGAEVIKVESREGGDMTRGAQRVLGVSMQLPGGLNSRFETFNRGKKSITLDLKKPEGKEIIFRLTERSDVFVQNFRPGVANRLGFDYETLSKYNQRLIYASASAYGLKGPDAKRPGMNMLGVSRSGAAFLARGRDEPPEAFGFGTADTIAATFLAFGIMTALVARERFGIGQEIDSSLLGGMIFLNQLGINDILMVKNAILEGQQRDMARNPLWNTYKCKDGKWLALANFQSDRYWTTFCKAMSLQHLEKDPRFQDSIAREKNHRELIRILDEIYASKTRQEWQQILDKEDLIHGIVNTIYDLSNDPQVIANDYIVDFDHPILGRSKMTGMPFNLSKTPGVATRSRAPALGEQTEEILLELGYSWEEIEKLKEAKVIS